jgi:hypothetical protein
VPLRESRVTTLQRHRSVAAAPRQNDGNVGRGDQ